MRLLALAGALLLVSCGCAAVNPTPIIIYVTPSPPTATTAPSRSYQGNFIDTGPMTAAGSTLTSCLLPGGSVLITGLSDVAGDQSSRPTADLYDPSSGTFSPAAVMAVTQFHPASAPLASAELYDPKSGTFSLTGSMTTSRTGATATLLLDGRVLIAGGQVNDNGANLASAELYDPKSGTFSPTGSMATINSVTSSARLVDGRVLVTGGEWVSQQTFAWISAELYDPQIGSFSPTGSMSADREFPTAALLADGRVLFAGGSNNGVFLASAEIYDPQSRAFSTTGSMAATRAAATAILLPDGRVLITGGDDQSGNLASAELFQ